MTGRVRQTFDLEALSQYAIQHIPQIKIPFEVKQVILYVTNYVISKCPNSADLNLRCYTYSLALGNPIPPIFSSAPTGPNVSYARSQPGNSSQKQLTEWRGSIKSSPPWLRQMFPYQRSVKDLGLLSCSVRTGPEQEDIIIIIQDWNYQY